MGLFAMIVGPLVLGATVGMLVVGELAGQFVVEDAFDRSRLRLTVRSRRSLFDVYWVWQF